MASDEFEQSMTEHAETRDRTGDIQIFSLTLSQLSYRSSLILYLYVPHAGMFQPTALYTHQGQFPVRVRMVGNIL